MKKCKLKCASAFFLALLVIGVGIIGYFAHDYSRFKQTPLAVTGQQHVIQIARGKGLTQIVDLLRRQHLTQAPVLYWRYLARDMQVGRSLQAGEYVVEQGTTPVQLLQKMARGKVRQYEFTLVDGWRFSRVRQALSRAPALTHTIDTMSDQQIMQALGATVDHPEGEFLPQTYTYTRSDSDMDVLRRAYEAMQKILTEQWARRDENLPLKTPYDALILASLIEKETANAEERSRISGVFIRRMKRGMRLQTDPTVIYGMGNKYKGHITRKALRTDTPYNTYIHAGLPPTPIAMPGEAAIHAALHPHEGKALYFVARGDGSGRHVFSATLKQHNHAVYCYRTKRCKQ